MYEDKKGHPLKLTVIGARDLRKADITGSSDPYVIMQVLRKDTNPSTIRVGNPEMQTKVIKKNLCPRWEQQFEIYFYDLGDMLSFQVLDKDTWKSDDMLGTGTLSCAQWGHPEGWHGEIKLAVKEGAPEAWLEIQVEALPQPEPVVIEDEGSGKKAKCNVCTI